MCKPKWLMLEASNVAYKVRQTTIGVCQMCKDLTSVFFVCKVSSYVYL